MKNNLTKLFVTVLSIVLLIGAVAGISVLANEADAYEIKSINVIHGDTTNVLIAVDLPSDTELGAAPAVEVTYSFGGETRTAEFHSYQYIAKYGAYYPVYYTVGIPAKDMGEAVVAEAHKSGSDAKGAEKSTGVANYLYTRLYKDLIIEAAEGEDADRKEMYLALLNYGAWAQKVLWNNKAENADNQRTLVTDYVCVAAKGATVNGSDILLLEKSAAVTLAGAPAAPAEYKLAGWQATSYDKAGKAIETKLLDTATYTPTASTLISPAYARAWEDYEDGKTSNSIDNTGGGATATIVTEGGNSFYRVAKPEGKAAQEYIYTPNAALTYTDSDCVVYEAKLRVDFDTSNQGSFAILYGRYNGFRKFSVQNEAAGSEELTISDWRDGAQTTLSGRIGVKVGEWFTFRVENYKDASDNLIARVYINGVYFGESTNAKTDMDVYPGSWNFNNVTISSNNNMLNCKLDIDDVYVGEGKMYGFDDIVNDFENSTVASTGGKVSHSNATVAIKNAGSSVEIAEENGNKFLQYNVDPAAGWMECVVVKPTVPAVNGSDKFVFEADVRTQTGTVLLNPFGTDSDGAEGQKTHVYFYVDGGMIRFNYALNNTWGKWLNTSAKAGEWFNVRLEYEGTNVKIFVDGDLLFEATNPDNKISENIKQMNIYTFSGSKGDTWCIDNLRAGFVEE